MINLTEQQTFIRDHLSTKNRIVKMHTLFEELGLRHMPQFIKDLDALERAGDIIISQKGGIRSVKGSGLIKGTVVSASKYFSFVQPYDGGEDVYVPCEQLKGALPGDQVIISCRQDAKGISGKVLSIFGYGDRTAVGMLRKFRGRLEFQADSDYRTGLEVVKNKIGAVDGDKVQVAVKYGKDGKRMVCVVEKIYGQAECARICADAIIDAYRIPTQFSSEVLDEAGRQNDRGVIEEDLVGRLDLRQENIFTIDGADAKDLDDAIGVKRTETGYELSVHIADVSHYVRDDSPLDVSALERGTSVYFADRVIPMYPEALSNGICSLHAGTDKLTFSAFMHFDKAGKLLDYRFVKSVIRSKVRGVYAEVNAILDGTASEEVQAKYAPVRDTISAAFELYELLRSSSDKRGNVHFTTIESRFVLDENGVCVGLRARESGQAEEMIEQFMIAANIAAAKLAKQAQLPFVYRVHEEPNPEALERVRQLLRSLGVNAAALSDEPSPSDVDSVLMQVKDTPYEQVISNALLRAMAKARYDEEPIGHFGLALADYCHFTSPIRRYPDSFIHRVLSAYVAGKAQSDIVKAFTYKAMRAAELSSEYEVRAVNAERRTEDCYMAEYMAQFVGEVFDGVISSVIASGFFVRLENSAEGAVRIHDLPDDSYEYDGLATLRGVRSGKRYRVGDPIRVQVAAAKISVGQVDFVPAETADECKAVCTIPEK